MTNAQVAAAFEQVADILEFQGANSFRVRAYRNAARTLGDFPESLAALVGDSTRKLTDIPGIGADLADKITTLFRTGSLPMLVELQAQVPPSVLALMRIPGLGPKKAAALHKQLGIDSLDALKAACESHQVQSLKGFGAKTEQTILAGLSIAAAADQRMLWAHADQIAQSVREHLASLPAVKQLELAGSYRRGKDTIGDLDVLVVADDSAAVMDRFAQLPGLETVLARGDTKMSVRVNRGKQSLQLDLRVVPAESFGAALQYFTGSKEHNVVVRGLAKDRGLKINEWGVFRLDGEKEIRIGGETEQSVYAALDLPVFPPELRENRQEFACAAAGSLPQLVRVEDLRGDLHMHTTETDGQAALEQMVQAARARGLSYIAITDHSQRVSMARGLDPARLRAQWKSIDRLNRELAGEFLVLKGIECDILERGGMDLPDDVLAEADWVLASVHYGQNQPRAQITDRILGALANPYVHCIAHPTGRLLNQREAYEVDLDAVMQSAREHRKLLELNANPHRLDLNDIHCAAAKKLGISIAISTDAHSTDGLSVIRFGILQARRAGLAPQDIANTRPWVELKKLFGR